MNPILQFEKAARSIWASKKTSEEKRERLCRVHDSIRRHIDRIDAWRQENAIDPWNARAFDRTRSYLVHLAADVHDLELQCERSAPAPKRSVVAKAT
jgi:hypothetical protein